MRERQRQTGTEGDTESERERCQKKYMWKRSHFKRELLLQGNCLARLIPRAFEMSKQQNNLCTGPKATVCPNDPFAKIAREHIS